MRVLFLSLEFSSGTFSGNGVAAQSQARALASIGAHVLVLAASPTAQHVQLHTEQCVPPDEASEADSGSGATPSAGTLRLIEVPVSTWGKLSPAVAPLVEYQAGLTSPEVVRAVQAFGAQVALVVDGSALPAWHALCKLLPPSPRIPYLWINFRVFTRTETGANLNFVRALEAEAMRGAAATIALSRSDRQYLLEHVWPHRAPNDGPHSHEGPHIQPGPVTVDSQLVQGLQRPDPEQSAPAGVSSARAVASNGHAASALHLASLPLPAVHVLLPALRGDMKHLPLPADAALSPEPHPPRAQPVRPAAHGPADRPEEPAGTCAASSTPACSAAPPSGEAEQAGGLPGAGVAWAGAIAADEVLAAAPGSGRRRYLSCVVRLAREKEPHLYVELVEALAARGALSRLGVVPLMVGAAADEYAQGIKARLLKAAPDSVIVEQFQGPEQLAAIYAATLLNVHPATYDAYGMTIVEAASQGSPSLVHDEGDGAVGATDLLRGAEGEVLLVNLKQGMHTLADQVEVLLADAGRLAGVARRAAERARSWDEPTHARELLRIVVNSLTSDGA